MRGQFLLAEMLTTPWALRREVLAGHTQVIARWLAGHNAPQAFEQFEDAPPGEQISAFDAARQNAQARVGSGSIAVLPLYGTIVQRAGMMTEWCGGTSTQQFSQALSAALADDTVGQILCDVDSPGGSVYGVQELGDQILQARKVKPVVAIANSLAASAAYWIASQASEFYVTAGGEVGSIGVWMAHEDWSQALAEAGVNTTLISAGAFKTEANPFQPLDDAAKAFLQSRVDDYYGAFTKAVARGRGVSVDTVRNGMGQGRVLGADAALAQGMVDGIATFDDVVKQMQKNSRADAAKKAERRAVKARNELSLLEA